ncbi:hypothetical protein AGLY_014782, partial [Aphis glycines]
MPKNTIIQERTILWYMTFWGFAINYMFRMNINIAIVSMIKHSISKTNITIIYECLRHTESLKSNNSIAQISSVDLNDNKFEWDEYQQNSILGAFFILHVIMQIPGGVLAQRYGTKTVFGISNGVAAVLSFAVPASAKFNYKALVLIRIIQGFISGAAWPSMHTMTANWIPPHERSRFVSAYLGSSVGTAVTYIMCGYLIASFGWESVFYVSGGLGLLWAICWILLVYDTPAKHPTISIRERTYIENCLGKTIQTRSKPLSIPWKSLLSSKVLWINLVTQAGGIWGLFTLAAQAPSYFNFVLGLNIKQTGLWSGMPHFVRWVFAFGYSNILQGFFILGLCYSGCNSLVAVIMLFSATAVNGAVSSGALAAVVDIAPNYAGVVLGIIGTVTATSGFISPLIVGYFTLHQQTLSQWCKVFHLSGAICIERTILWYMTFWGFAINYMFRMNINIAIVSMIKHSISKTNITIIYECLRHTESLKSNNSIAQISSVDLNDNKFEWDEYQQNSVLGAFFTLNVIMKIPGGVLAQRYGTKTVFGIGNGVAAILSFAVPASAKFNYKALVLVRIIQGFISGAAWPSMHTMTANWIPPHERSRFVSAYLGSSVGTAVTYIMCGYLIASFGWESVFYVSGGLGLLWAICWILVVYDTPAKHPTISIRERTYIENCLGKTIQNSSKPLSIPWKSLLSSNVVWINLVTQAGGIWGLYTLAAQAPSYFNFVLGLNIKQTGLWSGMPHFVRWVFAFGYSNILQGFFILGLCYSGCNSLVAVIMLFSATAVNGAVSSGALAAVVDIAPNYAGVILGIVGTVSATSGFISPLIVGYLTFHQQTLSQWCKMR